MTAVDATADTDTDRLMVSVRSSDRAFVTVAALVFLASAALTIHLCISMSAMGMPMPGGWTMSMAWMRMPDQSWFDAAVSFLGMWIAMMVAMMLPSLMPMLRRYRGAVRVTVSRRLDVLTTIVAAGYFFVWTLVGVVVYPIGVALAEVEMRQPALSHVVPMVVGVVVLIAGAVQRSAWKARHLACCLDAPGSALAADGYTAWQHGVQLGRHCVCCCVNLMAILLAGGVMDLRVMAIVTAMITLECVARNRERTARAIGVVVAGAGLLAIVRAAL